MSDAPITFVVDESLKAAFAVAARATNRSSEDVLRDLMSDFVNQQGDPSGHDAWFRNQVRIAIESAHGENLVPSDDVEAEALAWRSDLLRKASQHTA